MFLGKGKREGSDLPTSVSLNITTRNVCSLLFTEMLSELV